MGVTSMDIYAVPDGEFGYIESSGKWNGIIGMSQWILFVILSSKFCPSLVNWFFKIETFDFIPEIF